MKTINYNLKMGGKAMSLRAFGVAITPACEIATLRSQ
jgi:hypothetical protein